MRTAAPDVGADVLAMLESPQPPPIDVVLAPLLNDLNLLPGDVVLVLDDYHVIDDHDIHDGLAFLLDRLPAQVHLVIAGRADPVVPLARLRARGELLEIRAADVRFTPDEATAFLTDAMGLDLAAGDVAALEARTEGVDRRAPAIARELTVSLSTVRTHTKRIYRKLGVNNRRAAVRRAEQLSLSARSRTR